MLANDAHRIVKPKSKPLPRSFSREERLKYPLLQLRRNPGARIPDLDQHHVSFELACQAQAPLVAERVERILDQRSPYLVEFTAISIDARQPRLIIALNFHMRHARLQHLHRGIQSGRHIHLRIGARSMPEYVLIASIKSKIRAVECASVETDREARK